MDIILFGIVAFMLLVIIGLSTTKHLRLLGLVGGLALIVLALFVMSNGLSYPNGDTQVQITNASGVFTTTNTTYININNINSNFDTLIGIGLASIGVLAFIGAILL